MIGCIRKRWDMKGKNRCFMKSFMEVKLWLIEQQWSVMKGIKKWMFYEDERIDVLWKMIWKQRVRQEREAMIGYDWKIQWKD